MKSTFWESEKTLAFYLQTRAEQSCVVAPIHSSTIPSIIFRFLWRKPWIDVFSMSWHHLCCMTCVFWHPRCKCKTLLKLMQILHAQFLVQQLCTVLWLNVNVSRVILGTIWWPTRCLMSDVWKVGSSVDLAWVQPKLGLFYQSYAAPSVTVELQWAILVTLLP